MRALSGYSRIFRIASREIRDEPGGPAVEFYPAALPPADPRASRNASNPHAIFANTHRDRSKHPPLTRGGPATSRSFQDTRSEFRENKVSSEPHDDPPASKNIPKHTRNKKQTEGSKLS